MNRKELVRIVNLLNNENGLLENAGVEKIVTIGKGTQTDAIALQFKSAMEQIDDKELTDEVPEDCIDFYEVNLEALKALVKDEPVKEEVKEDKPVKETKAKKKAPAKKPTAKKSAPVKKPTTKKEPVVKKAPAKKKETKEAPTKSVGVIVSILEFIQSSKKPISEESLLEKLVKRFPDRNSESMAKTIKAQIGGKKKPCRMEKERNVSFIFSDKGVICK